MSFQSWHTYGYGVEISGLKSVSMSKVVELVQTAPEYAKIFNEWLEENDIEEPTWEELEEFDDTFCIGLATVLKEVILEIEKIELTACNDFNDKTYLLFAQTYPWWMNETEKSFKEEDVQSLMVKYLSKITDEAITIDYYEPENGG